MLAVKYRIHKWNKNNSSAWAGSWSGSTCGGLHAGCGALAAAGMCVFLEADCPRSSTSGLSNKDSLSVRVTGKKRRRAAAHVCHLTSTLWSKSSQPEGPDPRIHQRYISSSCQTRTTNKLTVWSFLITDSSFPFLTNSHQVVQLALSLMTALLTNLRNIQDQIGQQSSVTGETAPSTDHKRCCRHREPQPSPSTLLGIPPCLPDPPGSQLF